MGNILVCGKKKTKLKSNASPYLPISNVQRELVREIEHQIHRNEAVVRGSSANSVYSAPAWNSAVLPSVKSTYISPNNNAASLAAPKQISPKEVGLIKQQIAAALQTPNAITANKNGMVQDVPRQSHRYEWSVHTPSANSVYSPPVRISAPKQISPKQVSLPKEQIATALQTPNAIPATKNGKVYDVPQRIRQYEWAVQTPSANSVYSPSVKISAPKQISPKQVSSPREQITTVLQTPNSIPTKSKSNTNPHLPRAYCVEENEMVHDVPHTINRSEWAMHKPSVNTVYSPPVRISAALPSVISTYISQNNNTDYDDDDEEYDDDEYDDDEYNKLQTLSGALTFENNKYRTNAGQGNQQTKYIFKLYWPVFETRIFFKKNFKNFYACNSNGDRLIRLTNGLKSNPNHLTEENYLAALLIFADIEDLHCEEAIRVYNRKSEKLVQTAKSKTYIIKVPNLIDSRPSISVCSRLMIITNQCKNFNRLHGTISEIAPNHIEVEFYGKIDTSIQYEVNFLSNRTIFRMEKLAIELMKQKNLVHFMFPKAKYNSSSVCPNKEGQFSWFNKSMAQNPEQKTIIENIYNGTSYPYPYIVFGPPGTGKTTTLVESILQLWKNKCDSKILVVATSNFACNVISKRLLQFLPKTEIFRLFSKTQEVLIKKIDADVLDASNLKGEYYSPQPSELYLYRIIVATPIASGRLILDRFDNNFFTHLFIDECGSCTEGSSLIPIAGLISSQNKINANIVLAGDPLQLRPVIFSKYAEDLGYGVSMIERLMEFPLYMVDEQIGDYNNKYITKLRLNYRTHKDILHIPNQLFYKNELKAMGSKDCTDWIINWKHLPNPKFPIKFEAVFGESLSENDSPSLYNKHEIKVVMSQLKLLVNKNINGKKVRQSDIGVISPYRKQNQKIRAECDYRNWRDIEVASVEAFQGSEKSIIIFSTVRSNVDTMGFLDSERRLNVALTRAKGFLVIIGDPKVLMMDKCWYQLMKYCYDNNAICGEPFKFYS